MGHRTVKRVPLDFDAPLNKVWQGYLMPDEMVPPRCPDCDATGYSPTARWLQATFYDHSVREGVGGWNDKLVQADVDALVEAGRLRHLVKREPTEDNSRRHEWITVPRTAEEVNAAQHGPERFLGECSHDAINVHIMVESRCERLGAPSRCERCGGEGMLGTDEERAAYDNWTGTEPPEGEGWQLWETTSEGSPQSPVFASAEALAAWCEGNATVFADMRWTAAQWLASFKAETTDVDTLLVLPGPEPAER
jgi:hypothetical protein